MIGKDREKGRSTIRRPHAGQEPRRIEMNTNVIETKRQSALPTVAAGLALALLAAPLLAGCNPALKVGALQTESQSVALGDAEVVRVQIGMGAGDLEVTSGAEGLLEADFTYNVAKLKPVIEYTDDKLSVRHPNIEGVPALLGITEYRNEWDLRLAGGVPMEMSVEMGGGSGDLQLAGLSLTGLDLNVGAGDYAIDLSGDWAQDADVAIDAGAANLRLQLPADVGARVEVDSGPHTVSTSGLTQSGSVYTNAAYGEVEVTLDVHIQTGIGHIDLEVVEAAATRD